MQKIKKLGKLGDVHPSLSYAHFVASNPSFEKGYDLLDYLCFTLFADKRNIRRDTVARSWYPSICNSAKKIRQVVLPTLQCSLSQAIAHISAEGPLLEEALIIDDLVFQPKYYGQWREAHRLLIQPERSSPRVYLNHPPLFRDILIFYCLQDISLERKAQIFLESSSKNKFVYEGINNEIFSLLEQDERKVVRERWLCWKAREEPKFLALRTTNIIAPWGFYNLVGYVPPSLECVMEYYGRVASHVGLDYKGYLFDNSQARINDLDSLPSILTSCKVIERL
ncbi:MAG: hypothetical protein AABX82_09665 [Nanoarchaeota archaeon]